MTKRETSGQITELERGRRYSIRVRLAPDETHKSWHWSKSRKVNGNKAEATAALVAYKKELEEEKSGRNVTVDEYAEAFQANRKALGKVSALTIERDQHEIDRIVKYLGTVRVVDLDSKQIESAYLRMSEDDGASPDAIHKIHMKLSQIMRKAYLDELIDRNPCDAVEGIRRPKVSQQKRRETRITKEQALTFVHKIRQEPQDGRIVAVWLGIATGLRRGEALAFGVGGRGLRKRAFAHPQAVWQRKGSEGPQDRQIAPHNINRQSDRRLSARLENTSANHIRGGGS